MKRFALLPLLAVLALVVGCDKKNPTEPEPSSDAILVVVSPGADTLTVGASVLFTAVASDSDGVDPGLPLSWSSSNPAVFAVNGSGRVTGVGEGTALLIVRSGAARDTATVRVEPALGGWFAQVSNSTAELNGVFFLPDGRTGWAVGDGGRILRTLNAGVTWTAQVSNTAFPLEGVWFTGSAEGWAVGGNGTVLHTTNSGVLWTRVLSVPASEVLYDVHFATRDTGWAVGANGVVLRTFDRGDTWQKLYPTGFTLRSVSFAGTRDGWAVGDNGVILGTHNRGLAWFIVQPSVTGLGLSAVWRRADSLAFAAGEQGVVPRTEVGPDSTRWILDSNGAANQLEGVHFPTDLTGYTVGWNGVGIVLRSDDGGSSWLPQIANTQYRLNDVFFVDDRRGWAVGANGTILHTGTGGE